MMKMSERPDEEAAASGDIRTEEGGENTAEDVVCSTERRRQTTSFLASIPSHSFPLHLSIDR